MPSYVQLKCCHCGEYQLVDKEKRFESYECRRCHKTVEPDIPKSIGSPNIISDRTRVGPKLSSEFRTGVLDKIMSVRGANNDSRKYG